MLNENRRSVVMGVVVLIVGLLGGTAFAMTHLPGEPAHGSLTPSDPQTGTAIPVTGHPPGIGSMQTTEEGLTITLVRQEKQGALFLFQFQVKNTTHATATMRAISGQVHQFIISGNTQVAPPNNIGEAQLNPPPVSENAATYPALAATLPAGATTEGWLAVDTTHLDFPATQLLYRYRAVPTVGCADPADPSTCQPATLYQALIWNLP